MTTTLLVGVGGLPAAGQQPQEEKDEASPQPGPTKSPTPIPGPTGPTPTPTASPAAPAEAGAASVTDTEYLAVQIDEAGGVLDTMLKDWLRVRGPAGQTVEITDPGRLVSVQPTGGTPAPGVGDSFSWDVTIPDAQFRDLYYEGEVMSNDEGRVLTGEGQKKLPVSLGIKYYTGPPGAETEVTPEEFEANRGPAKIVFSVKNETRQMQEVTYNDVQTGKQLQAVAPVWTPYVVRIGPIRFPDDEYDQIQTDGQESRSGNATEVTWTLNLAPPDYDSQQTAIVQFLGAQPQIPELDVIAQPQYPQAGPEAISSEGIQFQKGRRSFLFDVFDLLRSNLVALTGLFGLLDDAFANLALPLISPEKGNREAGTFDDPNQLWALWTLAKGMEQLDRALNVIDYSVQLSRNAVKGQLATLSQMRLLLGKSTDKPAISLSTELDAILAPILGCATAVPPTCNEDDIEGAFEELTKNEEAADELLEGSIWQNIKDLEVLLGCDDCGADPHTFLPEAPASVVPSSPQASIMLSIIRLKLALFEQNLAALQKEDHSNQLATFTGLSDTAASTARNDWSKFTTITFPFGMEELDRGLYALKVNGIDLLQQALGNKDQPNSIIWAMHVLTDGMESLSDSFHQLGATWRYLADSIQNFGIFGIETSKNTLQLDINAIDIESAQRAAAAARVTEQPTTFMGSPDSTKDRPVDTQFVLVYSTGEPDLAGDSPFGTLPGRVAGGLALALLVATLLALARFRWFLI